MHPLLSTLNGQDIGLIFGLAGIGIGVVFGLAGMYFAHRRRALWHETARLALEKGVPIPMPPPDLDSGPEAGMTPEQIRQHRSRGLLLSALINLGVGAGMYLGLRQVSPTAAYFAAIPVFVGLALLCGALIESAGTRGSSDRRER